MAYPRPRPTSAVSARVAVGSTSSWLCCSASLCAGPTVRRFGGHPRSRRQRRHEPLARRRRPTDELLELVGEARFVLLGELNLGQLTRRRHPDRVCIVGFTTHDRHGHRRTRLGSRCRTAGRPPGPRGFGRAPAARCRHRLRRPGPARRPPARRPAAAHDRRHLTARRASAEPLRASRCRPPVSTCSCTSTRPAPWSRSSRGPPSRSPPTRTRRACRSRRRQRADHWSSRMA